MDVLSFDSCAEILCQQFLELCFELWKREQAIGREQLRINFVIHAASDETAFIPVEYLRPFYPLRKAQHFSRFRLEHIEAVLEVDNDVEFNVMTVKAFGANLLEAYIPQNLVLQGMFL